MLHMHVEVLIGPLLESRYIDQNRDFLKNRKKSQKNRTDLKHPPMNASRRDLSNDVLHEPIRSKKIAHLGRKMIIEKIQKIPKNREKTVRGSSTHHKMRLLERNPMVYGKIPFV